MDNNANYFTLSTLQNFILGENHLRQEISKHQVVQPGTWIQLISFGMLYSNFDNIFKGPS